MKKPKDTPSDEVIRQQLELVKNRYINPLAAVQKRIDRYTPPRNDDERYKLAIGKEMLKRLKQVHGEMVSTLLEDLAMTADNLVDRFFTDLHTDPTAPADWEEALRAWLWFICPAGLRAETKMRIRADPRWHLS